jgi:hypothetical protein
MEDAPYSYDQPRDEITEWLPLFAIEKDKRSLLLKLIKHEGCNHLLALMTEYPWCGKRRLVVRRQYLRRGTIEFGLVLGEHPCEGHCKCAIGRHLYSGGE